MLVNRDIKHIDGKWNTSETKYDGRKIVMKSRKNRGMKCHVYLPNSEKVDFTLRYNYIKPDVLLQKVINKINK